jgi:hypothetical protein
MYGSVEYLHCPMAVLILALMLWGLTPIITGSLCNVGQIFDLIGVCVRKQAREKAISHHGDE